MAQAEGDRRLDEAGLVAAVEATTLLGGAIGSLVLHNISHAWLAAILTHVGGGFLFLAGQWARMACRSRRDLQR